MKNKLLIGVFALFLLFGVSISTSTYLPVSIEAHAEEGIDVSALKALYESIPEKSTWNKTFISTEKLVIYYDIATDILKEPAKYHQDYVDIIMFSLQDTYGEVQWHTTAIKLSKSALTLKYGATHTLTVERTPAQSADKIVWTSSDSNSVIVNNGVVKVVKYSTKPVIITATCNGKTDTCTVTSTNPLASVKLNSSEKTTYKGSTFTLNASVLAEDGTSNVSDPVVYMWDCNAPDIAKVDEYGKVTALNKGTATIICTAKAGSVSKTVTCKLTVSDLIEITGFSQKFTTVGGAITLIEGQSETLSVAISPETATVKVLKWKSSDTSILKVESSSTSSNISSAKVTALKLGTVNLTYTATDGSGASGKVIVNVKPKVTSIKLSASRMVITPGNSKNLTATVSPSNAGNKVLKFESTDNNVASVSGSGKITAKNSGTVNITATTTDGSNISKVCKVRVANSATAIKLNTSSVVVNIGKTATIKPTVTTAIGTTYNDFVKFTSSNEKVATVNSDGVITPVGVGSASIIATTMDGTNRSASCIVRVLQPVTGVSCLSSKSIEKKESFTLKPTVSPSNASNKSVTFKSSDESIATVNANGVVTAKSKEGKCKITVTTVDGSFKAACTVTVLTKTTSIKLNSSKKTIKAGNTFTLKATVSPSNATDKTVKWSTSDKKVAKVDSNGLVTAVAGGKCIITAKSSGGQTANCAISVTQGITKLSLKKTMLTLYKGQKYTIAKVVTPSTSTITNFKWTSSNTSIATVDKNGLITAKGIGNCTIKVQADGKTASAKVTVTKVVKATAMSVIPREISLAAGKSTKLTPEFTPSNTSVKTVSWKSSNSKIATVDSNGNVTAKATGSCRIVCTSIDGGFTSSCVVSVNVPITGLRFKSDSFICTLGGSKKLNYTVYPSNASNYDLVWSSSNPKVATVDSNGKVKGLTNGTTTITVKTPNGKITATTKVKVLVQVTGVKLDKSKITMEKGDSYGFVVAIQPKNATNKKLKWSSNNKSVATVKDGVITALRTGNAVITVTTSEGGYTASCNVKIIQPATSVQLQYSSMNLIVGSSVTVQGNIRPVTATNKKVKWSSSDKNIATVSTVGKIKAVAPGSCLIICKSADGYASSSIKLTVTQPVKSISFEKSSFNLPLKGTAQLVATIKPKNATNKKLIWGTNNPQVASVDSNGNIKGLSLGSCTITARTPDGVHTATIKVTVYTPVSSITLNTGSAKLNVGKSMYLIPSIKPSKAYIQTVKWSSNNTDVATVDSTGKVTAVGPGYAVIIAKTKDGGKTAKCSVNVVQPVKGVSLNVNNAELDVDETLKLKATVKPKNATNPSVKWTSSNSAVAMVDKNGIVTALKKGKAVITCTTNDGKFSASCSIVVLNKVHEISLNLKKTTAYVGTPFVITATVMPQNATNKTVTWSSSNQDVCVVNSSGKVTPLKAGTAVITVTSKQGGIKAKCTVTVENPAQKLTLSSSKATMKINETLTLLATVTPANTTNKTVTWTSSDPAVAKVSAKGVVTAKKSGSVIITATTSNGISKTCKIIVN